MFFRALVQDKEGFIEKFLKDLNEKSLELNIGPQNADAPKKDKDPFYNEDGMCKVVGVYREKNYLYEDKQDKHYYDVTLEVVSRFDDEKNRIFLQK